MFLCLQLEKMVIGHDNRGDDSPWLLEEVHVDIPSRDENYVFRCGKWLKINNGRDETETVLYPGKNSKILTDRCCMKVRTTVTRPEFIQDLRKRRSWPSLTQAP